MKGRNNTSNEHHNNSLNNNNNTPNMIRTNLINEIISENKIEQLNPVTHPLKDKLSEDLLCELLNRYLIMKHIEYDKYDTNSKIGEALKEILNKTLHDEYHITIAGNNNFNIIITPLKEEASAENSIVIVMGEKFTSGYTLARSLEFKNFRENSFFPTVYYSFFPGIDLADKIEENKINEEKFKNFFEKDQYQQKFCNPYKKEHEIENNHLPLVYVDLVEYFPAKLQDLGEENKKYADTITEEQALAITLQLADIAEQFAEKLTHLKDNHVVCSDLKIENILLRIKKGSTENGAKKYEIVFPDGKSFSPVSSLLTDKKNPLYIVLKDVTQNYCSHSFLNVSNAIKKIDALKVIDKEYSYIVGGIYYMLLTGNPFSNEQGLDFSHAYFKTRMGEKVKNIINEMTNESSQILNESKELKEKSDLLSTSNQKIKVNINKLKQNLTPENQKEISKSQKLILKNEKNISKVDKKISNNKKETFKKLNRLHYKDAAKKLKKLVGLDKNIKFNFINKGQFPHNLHDEHVRSEKLMRKEHSCSDKNNAVNQTPSLLRFATRSNLISSFRNSNNNSPLLQVTPTLEINVTTEQKRNHFRNSNLLFDQNVNNHNAQNNHSENDHDDKDNNLKK